MKKNKWLTLLSLVLGASTVLGACGGGNTSGSSSSSSSSDSSTDVAPVVEATFSNFIDTEYKADWKDMSSNVITLNDEYGTLVGNWEWMYLFKKEDKNFLKEVVQTWTLYNAKKKAVVWSKEHKYEEDAYTGYDKYGEKFPPVEISVSLEKLYGQSNKEMAYVQVTTVTKERYSDETLKLWEDEFGRAPFAYKTQEMREYYSADGKLIASTKLLHRYYYDEPTYGDSYDNGNCYAYFGKTVAEFDEDGNLVSTWDGDTTTKRIYVEETDKYGYLYTLYGGAILFEVRNKADNALVYEYTMGSNALSTMQMPFVLENGDIFVQERTETESLAYDFLAGDTKYNLTTNRVDVETGAQAEVEFNYFIKKIIDQDEWEEEHPGLNFSNYVYNVAYARKIEDGVLGDEVILFFDNALNVQYEWAPLIPEQVDLVESESNSISPEPNLENIQVLETGDLLIDLKTPVRDANGNEVNKAIVSPNGRLICYVPKDAMVIKEYIIPTGHSNSYFNVYNFDGEKVDYIDLDEYAYGDWEFDANEGRRLGDYYVFEYNREVTYDDVQQPPETEYKLLVVKKAGRYDYYGEDRELYMYNSYECGRIVDSTVDYLITEKDGQYCLYDADLDHILTMSDMFEVDVYDNCFVVEAEYDGETIVYVIPLENRSGNNDDSYKPDNWGDSSSGYKGGDEE